MSEHIPYVKPEDRDARWYLFTKKFYCRVPNLQTRSLEHVKHFGVPYSGDPRFDQQMAKEVVDRYLTIVEMVEFFNQGINIAVKNYSETETIYNLICDHLRDWEQKLIREGSIDPVVSEDLIKLDEFAKVVYDKAKYLQKNDNFVNSLFARRVESVFDHTPEELLPHPDVKNRPVPETQEQIDDRYPEYVSLAKAFADAAPKRVRSKVEQGIRTKTDERNYDLGNGAVSTKWGG